VATGFGILYLTELCLSETQGPFIPTPN